MRSHLLVLITATAACSKQTAPEPAPVPTPAPEAAPQAHGSVFGTLPMQVDNANNPITQAKVDLGRLLFYEKRVSKNHDISCNSCHTLTAYGVDGEPTSPGHKGVRGDRNSPTVYNAALHIAQFWDGREPDVEAQAKGPVLNPVEMAMPDADYVVTVLKSIPAYADLFAAAFPDDAEPINYDNFGDAVGAFERKLLTPAPFDDYLAGSTDALTEAQRAGLDAFVATGCASCHNGVAVGGASYQKLGIVKPYESDDLGRFKVTEDEADKSVFKVPSLRNITKTGPYFHDGKVATLDEAVKLMARLQLGQDLTDEKLAAIMAFLGALEGALPTEYIAEPEALESGPDTPKPDPS